MNHDLLYAPSVGGSRAATIALTSLRLLLAAFFVLVAIKNLAGDEAMASDFARWGYPDWFRVTTAVLQLAGAALLLSPSVSFHGAALLGCVLFGAVATHAIHDPPMALLSPVVFLGLVAPVLVAFRPALLR